MLAPVNLQPLGPLEMARLRELIRTMDYKSPIYHLLKDELTARGYWKLLPRGKASPTHFVAESVNARKAETVL